MSKNNRNNRSKQAEGQFKISNQTKAIIVAAVTVFLLAIIVIPQDHLGGAGAVLQNFIFGMFGFCAFFLPIILSYIVIMLAREKEGSSLNIVILASVFTLLLGTAFEVLARSGEVLYAHSFWGYVADSYQSGRSFGGGFFGSLLSFPLVAGLGEILARVTIITVTLAVLMVTTGTTFKKIGAFAKKTGEIAAEKQRDVRETRKRRMPPPPPPADTAEAIAEALDPNYIKQVPRTPAPAPKFDIDVPMDDLPEHPPVLDDLYDESGKPLKKLVKKPEEKAPVKRVRKKDTQAEMPEGLPTTAVTSAAETFYKFPPFELLKPSKNANQSLVESELKNNCDLLVNVLKSFGVEVRVTGYSRGPSVTRYEIQPSVGVRISKITGLADDIALQLRASSVRIAPIPNKSVIGIEVPNVNSAVVGMRDIIAGEEFARSKSKIMVALGRDVSGNTAVCDLAKMPHLLVAGTTGSGKSVCLNAMIMSILYRASPDDVKFVMIDPKAVEFPVYNGIPHLIVPVVTDQRKAAGALGWAVIEMEKRYKIMSELGVRNLAAYNDLSKKRDDLEHLPQIVIIIDEFADLMMVAGNEVENSVCRIAQKARAAGMHLVIATQRPDANVFTGLIKSNIPSRIALAVASQVNSQIIIDMGGAEKLLGKGDMLYMPVGEQKPLRVQGCFVSDDEVKKVAKFIKESSEEAEYDDNVMAEIERQAVEEKESKGSAVAAQGDYDSRINEAIEVVVEAGMASTSLLQRKLKLGYARAARIIDELEEKGVVGEHQGSKPRAVLLTRQNWLEMQNAGTLDVKSKEPAEEQLEFEDIEEIEEPQEKEYTTKQAEQDFLEDEEEFEFIDEEFLDSI